jgi:hypothetical protein
MYQAIRKTCEARGNISFAFLLMTVLNIPLVNCRLSSTLHEAGGSAVENSSKRPLSRSFCYFETSVKKVLLWRRLLDVRK